MAQEVRLGTNNLINDAWGRPKFIHDRSVFHGMWTYDVPDRVWEENSVATDGSFTALSATGTLATSVDNMLELSSGTTTNETSNLDTAFQTDRSSMQLIVNEWNDLEVKNVVINPAEDSAPFYLTGGDIMIVAVQSIAGDDDCAVTLYLSEEL